MVDPPLNNYCRTCRLTIRHVGLTSNPGVASNGRFTSAPVVVPEAMSRLRIELPFRDGVAKVGASPAADCPAALFSLNIHRGMVWPP